MESTSCRNNHFDQDGLASAFALVEPDEALARREHLVDVARAGDFGTWANRDAARLAMAIAACADPERSPFDVPDVTAGYEERCAYLYMTLLPRLTEMFDGPRRSRSLWEAEDAHLQASLDALASGAVRIDERPSTDLAIVTVPEDWAEQTVHRFTQPRGATVHPMAVNNATDRLVLMVVSGVGVHFEQRYETWVMHPSRSVRPRQDLRVLAGRLTDLEPGSGVWEAEPPSALTPRLAVSAGDSRLTPIQVRDVAERFLTEAPPAWDPFAANPG